jgi:hypothetical protein
MSLLQIQDIKPFKSLVFHRDGEFKFRLPILGYTSSLEEITVFGKSLERMFGITGQEYYSLPEKELFHSMVRLLIGKFFFFKRMESDPSLITYLEPVLPLPFPIGFLDCDVGVDATRMEFSIIYDTDSSEEEREQTIIPATPLPNRINNKSRLLSQDTSMVEQSLLDAIQQFQMSP